MIIANIISSLNYGGAEKQTVINANLMVQKNDVYLFYFFDGPLKKLVDKKVKLIQLQKNNYINTTITLAKLVKNNDIQLIHSSLFASMIISALCSLIIRVKVVWHFHSHEYELPWIHSLAFKVLSRLPNVKRICFVNNELIEYFIQRGFNFPRHKMKLLYNNTTINQPVKNNIREKKKIIIGYVGRLVSLKRVEYLVELAHYLVKNNFIDFQIWIIGDGEQRDHLELESVKNKLQDYISFMGFQEDVEEYYTNFDLFVNPSQEECLSIALIDAGICGIPSLAFDVGGNSEIILNKQTGYIVNIKEQLFERILFLIKNKTLREKMGKNASEHCLSFYSKEVHLQQLLMINLEAME